MIDIVDHTLAVADVDQGADHINNVFLVECRRACFVRATKASVELHPAHSRQVVTLRREEQILEQVFSRFLSGWLARAHHAINLNQGLEHAARAIHRERVGDEGAAIVFVGVDGLDRIDTLFAQFGKQCDGDFSVALGKHFTRLCINNVFGQSALFQVLLGHRQRLDTGIVELTNVARRNPSATLNDELLTCHDVEGRHITLKPLGHQSHSDLTFLAQLERGGLEEHLEDSLGVIAQRTQKHSRRQLAATVYSNVD